MGPELTVHHGRAAPAPLCPDGFPWKEARPRVRAYLVAAGFTGAGRLDRIAGEIDDRLRALLPLREGENPVEVAMRETARWVEEQQPDGVAATPDCERLTMLEQPIDLHVWRRWRRAGGRRPAVRAEGPAGQDTPGSRTGGPARGIGARRAAWLGLTAATTVGAVTLMGGSMQQGGLSPLELLLILLYAVLFAWICAAFWTAFMGFIVRLFRIRRWDIESYVPASPAAPGGEHTTAAGPRTALVMPVYNEAPDYVHARLRAMWSSIRASNAARNFDLFILSDTRDPDIQVQEERHWASLCAETGGAGRIFYRHRQDNRYRKAGNIADFVRSWGGKYRYMAILDADSLMSGETLGRMVEILEASPAVAVLQAPPVPVNSRSLFGRLLQFAAAVYGPLYTAGMNFWQAGDGSYFGHNALIRVAPFARHCGLPHLPGREPLGGPILSHDFVEAATLRRAGWEVWLAHNLEGSFEEIPPTLIDYAKRDRRWCQGNLQHGRMITAGGWRGLSRLHFSMALMSYLASPLWFLFLLAAGVEAWLQSRETPVYFFGHSLFPVWPPSYAFELKTVLIVTLTILFLPKVLALVLLFAEPQKWQAFGGRAGAIASVVLESLFSVIVAPVLMLFQTKFVTAILLRQNVGWPAQQRTDHATTFGEAIRAHGSQLLLGVLAGLVAWFYIPGFFWWFTPVLAGLLLAVPVSMLTSRTDLGDAARRRGLFLTPQETQPEPVLEHYRAIVEADAHPGEMNAGQPPWLAALLHPRVYALHRRLLPGDTPTRRQRHHLDGLMYTLADHSAEALTDADRRAMLANPECLRRLHIGLWSELPLDRLPPATADA